MIKKYRKKPVEIEAVQWTGNNFLDEITEIAQDNVHIYNRCLFIDTLEGQMVADVGDYIIKGIQGEIYPCKPDIFEATYEEVK